MFDINDFDETLPGPWEWDVKRLAASLAVAGRENGYTAKQRDAIVRASVTAYREAMRAFAGVSNLTVWYARQDVDELLAEGRSLCHQVHDEAHREDGGEGSHQRQHARVLQAHPRG